MARLTIRQASQQGFASTLTIHRHIKEGTLPVYEEGDAKLLEVDDLIAVFGEPGLRSSEGQPVAPVNGRVDIHEYNRMKAELEQKNRKNMWLAADLAEVVRELKEKEARFEKERNRLLTVLEQAQALLLREVERTGGTKRPAAEAASAADPEAADQPTAEPEPESEQAAGESGTISPATNGAAASPAAADSAPPTADPLVLETPIAPAAAEPGPDATEGKNGKNGITAGLPPIPPEGAAPPEETVLPPHKEDLNPLIPPLEDPMEPRRGRRALGTTTWLLLFVLAGGGFAFFEFRTKIMMGVTRVLQALS